MNNEDLFKILGQAAYMYDQGVMERFNEFIGADDEFNNDTNSSNYSINTSDDYSPI